MEWTGYFVASAVLQTLSTKNCCFRGRRLAMRPTLPLNSKRNNCFTIWSWLIAEIMSHDLTATKEFVSKLGRRICKSRKSTRSWSIFWNIIRTIKRHNRFFLRAYYDDDNLDCNDGTLTNDFAVPTEEPNIGLQESGTARWSGCGVSGKYVGLSTHSTLEFWNPWVVQ